MAVILAADGVSMTSWADTSRRRLQLVVNRQVSVTDGSGGSAPVDR